MNGQSSFIYENNSPSYKDLAKNQLRVFKKDGEYYTIDKEGNTEVIGGGIVKAIKVSLTAAQIKTLNSSPVLAIDSPGVGKYISVVNVDANLKYGTTPFNVDPDVQFLIQTDTASRAQMQVGAFLSQSSNAFERLQQNVGKNLLENKALYIKSESDATTGDSDIDVYIHYIVQSL